MLVNTLRTGVDPSGHALDRTKMPWPTFGKMDDDELGGLAAIPLGVVALAALLLMRLFFAAGPEAMQPGNVGARLSLDGGLPVARTMMLALGGRYVAGEAAKRTALVAAYGCAENLSLMAEPVFWFFLAVVALAGVIGAPISEQRGILMLLSQHLWRAA